MIGAMIIRVHGGDRNINVEVKGAKSELEARRAAFKAVWGSNEPTQETLDKYTSMFSVDDTIQITPSPDSND